MLIDFNGAMACAALCGHEDIVRVMLFKEANNYNTGLTSAAAGGHESIVRLMLELGANDFNVAMVRAVLRGYQKHSRTNSGENELKVKNV